MIPDDAELLRRYLDSGAEDAFATLVQRHIGHVYATALRRVGNDAQLAEDVAQKVFSDLARKAPALRNRAALGGWLHIAAQVTAAAVVRAEQRRKTREASTAAMQDSTFPPRDQADLSALQPALDEALVGLKDTEREAIVLRFFQQRSFAEVGAALRVSEDGARKRVERALEKLRRGLARRGITATAVAVGAALGAVGTIAVPALVASRVASGALAGAAAGGGATSVFWAAVAQAAWPAAAVVAVATSLCVVQQNRQRALAGELERLRIGTGEMAAVRAENDRLAGALATAEELRRAGAKLEELRQAAAARPGSGTAEAAGGASDTLVVKANGTLEWRGERVSLAEFVRRLKELRERGAATNSAIAIAAPDAGFSALAYVIDETRKAGINEVVVTSATKPEPKLGFSWF